MEKEKVLITSSRYLPNIGGIENSLYFLSEAFSDLGYEVFLVASNVVESGKVSLPKFETRGNNIKIIRYNYYFFSKPSALVSYFSGFVAYRKLKKANEFKVVVCRNHVTVLLCWLAGFRNISYVLPGTVRAQNDPKKSGLEHSILKRIFKVTAYKYHQTLQKLAIRLAQRNYVFSGILEEQVRLFLDYKGSVFKTKPGVDSNKFKVASPEKRKRLREGVDFSPSDIVLLGVGRFVEAKRFDLLIECLNYLPDRFKVVLVGSGGLKDQYKQLVEIRGLQRSVRIFGATDRPQDFYNLADIFVMSSTSETLGQTILEAQCSGLPIVAYSPDLPGVDTATEEVVNRKTSVMVDGLTPEKLASGVLEASDNVDSGVFCKHEIRKYAAENFSWTNMAESLVI